MHDFICRLSVPLLHIGFRHVSSFFGNWEAFCLHGMSHMVPGGGGGGGGGASTQREGSLWGTLLAKTAAESRATLERHHLNRVVEKPWR